jgi:hypothetical protein
MLDTLVDFSELREELNQLDNNCKACSEAWCSFTEDMLNDYIDQAFREFKIEQNIKMATKIKLKDGSVRNIKIEFKSVPKFYIVDDSLLGLGEGKRVIYFNSIKDIACTDAEVPSEFHHRDFTVRFNFVAQLRMQTPYKVKCFSLGCLPTSKESYLKSDDSQIRDRGQNSMRYLNHSYHSLESILSVKSLTPESVSMDPLEKQIHIGLHSRYQRYELMSPIPVAILIRTIRERYLNEEVAMLEAFYKDHFYNEPVPPATRILSTSTKDSRT